QARQNLDAVGARHLYIEKAYFGKVGCQGGNGFLRVGGLANDVDPASRCKHPGQTLQRQVLVIDQIDSQFHEHGNNICTTHHPSRCKTLGLASSPYKASGRPMRLSSPCPARIAVTSKPGPVSQTSMHRCAFASDAVIM